MPEIVWTGQKAKERRGFFTHGTHSSNKVKNKATFFPLMHRTFPVLLHGLGFALVALAQPCIILVAAPTAAAEYSDAAVPGLASLAAPMNTGKAFDRRKIAQNFDAQGGDDVNNEAREKLKKELDRIRSSTEGNKPLVFDPPVPVRRKAASPVTTSEAATPQTAKQPSRKIDPELGRILGRLLLMRFRGSQPADAGPKAIHALLQSGLIAGGLFSSENIQSKAQLKELMKFLGQAGGPARPLFAIAEIGSGSDNFPSVKDFERFPAERDVAAKGEPEYAYSTYRSMGASIAALGFNMNFGPALGPSANAPKPSASFGDSPLQSGVFAKTFILGHREAGVISVPIVEGSDFSVRALKTILVSYPDTPIAATMTNEIEPFAPYEGLVRGPRFCFVSIASASEAEDAAGNFNRGCDVLVLDGGSQSPPTVRDAIAQGVAEAIQHGELTVEALHASAQRLFALRSSLASTRGGPLAKVAGSHSGQTNALRPAADQE
jgi:hypothetical protein